jgi:hypothetical protein
MPKTMGPEWLTGQGRWLPRCGMRAEPVFTAAFLAQGAVRDGYRPLRHPISSLALGPDGCIQTVNSAVTGALRRQVQQGGTAHSLAAILVFFGLPAAAASYGWRADQPPVSRSTALPPR